jgi:hypothetical protein
MSYFINNVKRGRHYKFYWSVIQGYKNYIFFSKIYITLADFFVK